MEYCDVVDDKKLLQVVENTKNLKKLHLFNYASIFNDTLLKTIASNQSQLEKLLLGVNDSKEDICPLTEEGLLSFVSSKSLARLQIVYLGSISLSNEIATKLSLNCSTLRELNLRNCKLSDSIMDCFLKHSSQLQKLAILYNKPYTTDISDQVAVSLSKSPSANSIMLVRFINCYSLTDETARAIAANCPNVKVSDNSLF